MSEQPLVSLANDVGDPRALRRKLAAFAILSVTFAALGALTPLMYGAWGRMAVHPKPGTWWVAAGLLLCVGMAAWLAKRWIARSGAGPEQERSQ